MICFSRNFWPHQAIVFSLIILGTATGARPQVTDPAGKLDPTAATRARLQKNPIIEPQDSSPSSVSAPSIQLQRKQKQEILRSNFEKMKHDAEELAGLAKSLQEDLSKSNENVFSLKIVDKAEKIEKLAKKIKNAARGY